MFRKLGYLLTAAMAAFWLTACGGGGGGTSTTDVATDTGGTVSDGGSGTATGGGTDTTAGGGGTTDTGTTTGGGSGGTVTVSGLELPKEMDVVTAVDTTSTAAVHTSTMADTSGFAATADYNLDTTRIFAYDPSMEPLDTVNMILCLMDQTKASDMVNKGAYIALVNQDACEEGSNQSSGGAQQGQSDNASQVKRLNRWTIVSTRADDTSPMLVKIWVPGKPGATNPGDAQRIMVELTATEGVSDTKPFGAFSMNYLGIVDTSLMGDPNGGDVPMMKGMLATVENTQNQPQFKHIELDGKALDATLGIPWGQESAANVVLNDAAGTGGVARTFSHQMDPMGDQYGSFAVAFNATNLLRGEDTNQDDVADSTTCLSRVNFNTQIWRYNLYHMADGTFHGAAVTAGQRVELNGGFPFHFTKSDGSEAHGYLGYWGPWVDDGSSLADGTTIVRDTFDGSGTSTSYTVHVSPGKLGRHSSHTAGIDKLVGQQLWYWTPYPLQPGNSGYDASLANQMDWVVEVNPTTYAFEITGAVAWGENGPQVTDLATPIDITPTQDGDQINFRSDALGGDVVYVHDSTVAASSRQVTYFVREDVLPDDATLFASGSSVSLTCYDRCIKGGLTQTDVDAMSSEQDLFYTTMDWTTGQVTPHTYTLTSSGGTLTLSDSNGVVSLDGLDLSSLGIDWGMETGDMVVDASTVTDPWMIYTLPEIYRWSTGSGDWDHLVTVVDDTGAPVTFDQPLHFNYTLEAADEENGDPNGLAGSVYLLDYAGPNDFGGFPWIEDPVTHRWYSQVTLKSGVLLTDIDGNQYVVKQLEGEQAMKEDSSGGCSSLNVDSLFTDPALTLPTVDDIGTISFTWADKPEVTDPPAVIEGEVQ